MVARVLTLLVALVIAAIGTGLVLLYANQADERARDAYGDVEVFVAIGPVPAGTIVRTAIDSGLIAPKPISNSLLVEGSITPAALTGVDQELKVLTPLLPNQQLITSNIGEVSAADVLGLNESPNINALALNLGDPQRLAGFLRSGSRVAIYLTYTPEGEAEQCTQLLVQDIEVRAVGSSVTIPVAPAAPDPAAGSAQAAAPVSQVTLRVDQSDLAARLIQADVIGDMYFVMRGEQGEDLPQGECVSASEVFDP